MSEVQPLGDLIARLMAGIGAAEIIPFIRIRSSWKAIVGAELHRVCRPESLLGGNLTVVVSHPTWVQHLVFLKGTLLSNIRREVPGASVDGVVFRVGRMLDRQDASSREAPTAPLGDEELQAVERAIAGVRDPELKDALRGALRNALMFAPDRSKAGEPGSSRS